MTTKNQETESPSTKTSLPENKQKKQANSKAEQQKKSKKKNLVELKADLYNESQNEMSDLTSNFSTVARALMFGIIGTIWIITYSEEGLNFSNPWLFAALSLCLFYFLVDVIHYFCCSMICQSISVKAKKCNTHDEYLKQKRRTEKNNRRSVVFIVIKFIVLIIAATAFCIGLYTKMV